MDPMEEIWNTTSKPGKDGKRYILLKGVNDLAFLYLSGFVDVAKNDFKSWVESYAGSKLADGSYAVAHDQWIEKRRFRFEGALPPPFDLNSIPEKEYGEEEFVEILTATGLPNTQFDASAIPNIMANLRLHKKIQNGRVKLDKQIREQIDLLLNTYPHPQRVLQKLVEGIRSGKGTRTALSQVEAQRSSFAAGMTAQQIAQARLSEIAGELKKEGVAIPETEIPAVSLKELRKKKPPTGRI